MSYQITLVEGDNVAQVLELVAYDSLPKITVTLTGVDVTGYSFRLLVALEEGGTITKTGSVVDGPNGIFDFQFAKNELVAGLHTTQIEVTDTSTDVQTYRGPNLEVVHKIGGTI